MCLFSRRESRKSARNPLFQRQKTEVQRMCDAEPTVVSVVALRSRGKMNKKAFIVSILDHKNHNNAAFRTGSELCSGRRGCDWKTGGLAQFGHVELLRIRLDRLKSEAIPEEECSWKDANRAAKSGHLETVRFLRERGIHCTSEGADFAAQSGHLEVIRDLREHDVHCTSNGADGAAKNGFLDVIRHLHAHSVDCTRRGAEWAAAGGRLEIVRDLLDHGVPFTRDSPDWAARNGHLDVLRALRARGLLRIEQLRMTIWQLCKISGSTASFALPLAQTRQLGMAVSI